jgi:glycosyltransferase involved in cell wall biosynthesis
MTPRVAVVHPYLLPGGGSEACAMWMVQALQDDGRVTLITMGRPDLPALNESCGTSLDPGRIEIRGLRIPPGMRTRFDALRAFRLARYCRRHAGDFDVMVSAYNVMDFGVPGIQRIADFSFDDGLRRELHGGTGPGEGPLHRASAGRSLYLRLARALAGASRDGWKRNLTLANSEWTRGLLGERFGVPAKVLYPPVAGAPSPVRWEDREDGFVVMGRIVPEKGIPLIIEILAEVRKVKPIHLHILGRSGRAAYARDIEALCRRHGGWVHLEGPRYGLEKDEFLARHKYGISGCRHEAFGIAVAEMVKAGMVVWVPNAGGQTEIAADAGLVYSGRDDAVARILAVLGDPAGEAVLRDRLEGRAALFSPARFSSEMRSIVLDFLKEGHGRGA